MNDLAEEVPTCYNTDDLNRYPVYILLISAVSRIPPFQAATPYLSIHAVMILETIFTGTVFTSSSVRKEEISIYSTITLNFIKKALGCYRQRLAEINERIVELYRLGSDTDSIIESLTFRHGPDDAVRQKDLSSLLLRHKSMVEEQEQEIRMEMWRLAEEEETLKRVWICFRALDAMQFKIIQKLYVEKELYASVERESGMSHGKFEKERTAAMTRILELYHSDLDNLQILTQHDVIWRTD